ncbi:MAG: histidine kinase dimerization/phosphoacceptor domain-containing protein, partial [Myxococcota bacterium]
MSVSFSAKDTSTARALFEQSRYPIVATLAISLFVNVFIAVRHPKGLPSLIFFIVWSVAYLAVLPRVVIERRPLYFYAMLLFLTLTASAGMWWATVPLQALPTVVAFTSIAVLAPTRAAFVLLFITACSGYAMLELKATLMSAPIGTRFVMPVFGALVFGALLRRSLLAKIHAEALAERMAQLNKLLQTALATSDELAVARERARMARELHDSLGHRLTNSAIQLEAVQRLIDDNISPRAKRALASAQESMRAGLDDLRSCVTVLREESDERLLPDVLQDV